MEIIILSGFLIIPLLLISMIFGTHRGRKDKRNTAEINAIEKMKMYRNMMEDKDISNSEKIRLNEKIERLKKQHKDLF